MVASTLGSQAAWFAEHVVLAKSLFTRTKKILKFDVFEENVQARIPRMHRPVWNAVPLGGSKIIGKKMSYRVCSFDAVDITDLAKLLFFLLIFGGGGLAGLTPLHPLGWSRFGLERCSARWVFGSGMRPQGL